MKLLIWIVSTYEADVFSFTKNKNYKIRTSKKYIKPEDKVLIIDDFLANGNAALGLIKIVRQAEAAGCWSRNCN